MPIPDYGRNLTGYAYPPGEPVEGEPHRFVRRWVLRVARSLGEDVNDAVGTMEEAARRAMTEAYGAGAAGLDTEPLVRGVLIGEVHVVLEITCPTPEAAVGDSAAVITWTVLRLAHELWEIEDLEGIPRHFWFQLRSSAELQ